MPFGETVRQCDALVRLYLFRLATRKEVETGTIEPDVAIESWRYGGVAEVAQKDGGQAIRASRVTTHNVLCVSTPVRHCGPDLIWGRAVKY